MLRRVCLAPLVAAGLSVAPPGGFAETGAVAAAPFVTAARYDPSVPTVESLLGHAVGDGPASCGRIERVFDAIAASSPRVRIERYGSTHEGRPLLFAVVTSPENHRALEEILRRRSELPAGGPKGRRKGAEGAGEIPAVAWIGAAVHGDEPSGSDAAAALLYHLAADGREETRRILSEAIVLIDPLQNPDGRARFLAHYAQWKGAIPVGDSQSLPHRDPWPSGRGNHYLLDLNRDWIALSQPETRGRVRVFLRWRPEVSFDLHEMRIFDSYLFSPPRAPFNPHVPETVHKWWGRFASVLARAFGERGWTCYTEDWNEEFNPNRGASWPLLTGAVAMLGEQATVHGSRVALPGGGVATYREAVEHHFVAALALLEEVAGERRALIEDRIRALDPPGVARGGARAYLFPGGRGSARASRLAELLAAEGVPVRESGASFRMSGARDYWGEKRGETPFPAGTFVVPVDGPGGRLAGAILDFDPVLEDDFLTGERLSLETSGKSLLYENSAWSLTLSYGVEAYAAFESVGGDAPLLDLSSMRPAETPGEASFAYLLDPAEDGEGKGVAALLESGIRCWAAGAPFAIDERTYGVGAILVKRADNGPDLAGKLASVATRTGARFHRVDSPLTTEGPDLGSRNVRPLRRPRIALLAGPPFYESTFGALWFWLDRELEIPSTLLRLTGVARADLDRYDVIVAPDASPGKGPAIVAALGAEGQAALAGWVARGGTLIALGEATWMLYGGEEPLGGIRARRLVLDSLALYERAALREAGLAGLRVDGAALRRGEEEAVRIGGGPEVSAPEESVTPEEDEWLRRFRPRGAILRADLDANHWLSAGVGRRVPVLVKTDLALAARRPVETIGRFAGEEAIRLSGLLWPEARKRWAATPYLCRERIGRGQVIAFLGNPVYRAQTLGTARLFTNALLLGPGFGTAARIGE